MWQHNWTQSTIFSATVKLIIVLQCIGVSIEGGFEVSVCSLVVAVLNVQQCLLLF